MPRKLEKAEWGSFLDRISGSLQAEIEVASLNLGSQIEAEWLPLIALFYDPKDDLVAVSLEGLDHMIRRPREIYVEEEDGDLSSLEIIDAEGIRHIIKLRQAMRLPGS